MNYKECGVDINKSDQFVKYIKSKTFGVGGFSSLFKIPKEYKNPVIVSSTDGVGTKLELARKYDKFDNIGIDLVAMCVNDIITCGAKPLFFLDYFAIGKLNDDRDRKIIDSIIKGCNTANCCLVGGETAEMNLVYGDDKFDLAGFVTGVIEEDKIIDGKNTRAEDIIIGIESNGIHSNGFSLINKINYTEDMVDDLLKPTYIYNDVVQQLINSNWQIKGMTHITGGGLEYNINRILNPKFRVKIDYEVLEIPDIFKKIQNIGRISNRDMFEVFNMGVGYCLIVNTYNAKHIIKEINKYFKCKVIGEIIYR